MLAEFSPDQSDQPAGQRSAKLAFFPVIVIQVLCHRMRFRIGIADWGLSNRIRDLDWIFGLEIEDEDWDSCFSL